jgi:flagellar basal-body rod protein FlgB
MADDLSIMNYLEAGLKAEGVRQTAIANNIANMKTPGYRRVDIKFEEILAKAIDSGQKDVSGLKAVIYRPKTTAVNDEGNDVAMDMEIGELVKNSLMHKTYMLLLRKKYRQIEMATKL